MSFNIQLKTKIHKIDFLLIPDCPEVCTAEYKPVCGTDGKTYSNNCNLMQVACNDGRKNLTVAYFGECQGKKD